MKRINQNSTVLNDALLLVFRKGLQTAEDVRDYTGCELSTAMNALSNLTAVGLIAPMDKVRNSEGHLVNRYSMTLRGIKLSELIIDKGTKR